MDRATSSALRLPCRACPSGRARQTMARPRGPSLGAGSFFARRPLLPLRVASLRAPQRDHPAQAPNEALAVHGRQESHAVILGGRQSAGAFPLASLERETLVERSCLAR